MSNSVTSLVSCLVLIKYTTAGKVKLAISSSVSQNKAVCHYFMHSLSQDCVSVMCDIFASTYVPHSASSLASCPALIKSTQAEAMKPTNYPHIFPGEYSVHSVNVLILFQVFVSSVCNIAANKCVPHSAFLLSSCLVLIKSTKTEAMKPISLSYVLPNECSVHSVDIPFSSEVCVSSECDNVVRICVSENTPQIASCPVFIKSTKAKK